MRYEFQYSVTEEIVSEMIVSIEADSLEEAYEINEMQGLEEGNIVHTETVDAETLNVEDDGLVWSDDPQDR